jgi:hypothetical protein
MMLNPILREATQVYLVEGKGWAAYGYYLASLAAVQLLTLFLPSLDPGSWLGSAQLFKVSCVVALLSGVYFMLRLVNQEYEPWRFAPLTRWLQEEGFSADRLALAQLSVLGLYSILFIFLALPLLTWAAAVARTSLDSSSVALLVILSYFIIYGVWGLVTLDLWERRVESRHIFVRCLIGCFFIVTALVYLPLNPVAFLLSHLSGSELGRPVSLFGLRWSATAIHILFHVFLFACGFALCRWLLARKVGHS